MLCWSWAGVIFVLLLRLQVQINRTFNLLLIHKFMDLIPWRSEHHTLHCPQFYTPFKVTVHMLIFSKNNAHIRSQKCLGLLWKLYVSCIKRITNMTSDTVWAPGREEASGAWNGGAQIKAEQKCWGYHARTTKIDAERVRQRAREWGSHYSVMCLVREQENTADGHENDGKKTQWMNSSDPTGSGSTNTREECVSFHQWLTH